MVIPSRIALLLFGSGLCALIYQVTWLRELRLVFGASTPATATVLAVFMGGIGYGSARLAPRAEREREPLAFYAKLELLIAASVAVTPLLLWAVRAIYVAVGGTTAMGLSGGTALRLVGSALVLLPPTFLMGGTLPAAARAAEGDGGRRDTALLYGANTLGAVVGAALTTFLLIEVFGTRLTLWLGCAVNALVAMAARAVSRSLPELNEEAGSDTLGERRAPPRFVLAAAGAVGCTFLLLELVWYRMLAPLLGGSTYTFGLILAVALLGVGAGGLAYARRRGPKPTLATFAVTCALEALLVAIPLALGDRIALLTLTLRPLGVAGLWGHALGWSVVTAIVALPAAVVAGYQFPLLVALLGSGRDGVARDVGQAYAWNTVGAIVGSLAGGFLVLPLLTAPGAWRACVIALVGLGIAALYLHGRRSRRGIYLPSAIVGLTLAVLATAEGPTAVWRHSPIGAGRAGHVTQLETRNGLRKWMREQRYAVTWEVDGRESSIALHRLYDTAFIVNGKTDGSALGDATTQIMGGLLGAMLHGDVKRSMVIGLGTGSTAGWLGALPTAERVDVVEIEPAMEEVARALGAVNHDVLANPKVHIRHGDAREALLTSSEQYDLIFSEPSNPYRAGIASLFTRELYEAVRARLKPGGVFVQWLQGYDIDTESVRIVYATLGSVFGSVWSWRADVSDLLLIASAEDLPLDVATLRARMQREPYRTALMGVWRVDDPEGLLAHHLANPALGRAIAQGATDALINTDDRNLLEFSMARALGRPSGYSAEKLRRLAEKRGMSRPPLTGNVAWDRVADERMTMTMARDGKPPALDVTAMSASSRHRYTAFRAWAAGRDDRVLEAWSRLGRPPRSAIEHMVIADALASSGKREQALALTTRLRELMPTEAMAIEARAAYYAGDQRAAFAALVAALTAYRADPWPAPELMLRVLEIAPELARRDRQKIEPLLQLLGEPFVTDSLRVHRQLYAVEIAALHPDVSHCVQALAPFEPHTPWERSFLELRASCYERAKSPLASVAKEELSLFVEDAALDVESGLLP